MQTIETTQTRAPTVDQAASKSFRSGLIFSERSAGWHRQPPSLLSPGSCSKLAGRPCLRSKNSGLIS